VIGQIGFDGVIAVQNGAHVFEGRATDVSSWNLCFIRNALFVDYTGLPLAHSYAAVKDDFEAFTEMSGNSMKGGILFPWNEQAGGGMTVSNATFVNFKHACLRGCAHCGRGGSPVFGDGAFETRFEGMRFVNSSQRSLFRHPNEAFFYDLDGSLTGSGVREDWLRGGSVKGSSFVGTSVLLPPGRCTPSQMSSQGTGGSICSGLTFRRLWYHIRQPSAWVGKALCVRPPWSATVNTCQNLLPECNCLPYLKKFWKGNVFLAAQGYRYNVQQDLMAHELADPQEWDITVWDMHAGEQVSLTHRMVQWQASDAYGRPTYWTQTGIDAYPENFFQNFSACSTTVEFCGQIPLLPHWAATETGALDFDMMGTYELGQGMGGDIPTLKHPAKSRQYTIKMDDDANGALHTMYLNGATHPSHRAVTTTVVTCPTEGCWPSPLPPESEPDALYSAWSQPGTWLNSTQDTRNPLNELEVDIDLSTSTRTIYKIVKQVQWAAETPSDYDDVWIPKWRKVLLDMSTPIVGIGRLVIEGSLLINASSSIQLTATMIEIKGGSLIIATCDVFGNILGFFDGDAEITLLGTNKKLAAAHGDDPRQIPGLTLGQEALLMGPAVLGVSGSFIAKGRPVSQTYLPLEMTAQRGDTRVQVVDRVTWMSGDEIAITPSDYDMHEAEVRTISEVSHTTLGHSVIHFASPLAHTHYSGPLQTHGARSVQMQSRVALLTRNIVIRGDGQGEKYPYHLWNTQTVSDTASTQCGNGLCEEGETSLTCNKDCIGPAYEFGASILVASYTEDYTLCDPYLQCERGYRRSFAGHLDMDHVEIRYFGQNNLRSGIELVNLGDAGFNVSVTNSVMNRGYFTAIDVHATNGCLIHGNTIFRSHLPTLRVASGDGNVVSENLAIVSIFWHTHRGAIQGKGLAKEKLNAMIGAFHDSGTRSMIHRNIAAGSERAGFSGAGVECGDSVSFVSNLAHSSLAGYWFDHYSTPGKHAPSGCAALTDFTAWKIWEYGVYGHVLMPYLHVLGATLVDCRVGVWIHLGGASSLNHVIENTKVVIKNSLIVGHSANGHCLKTKPTLHACTFYMAWCYHLPAHHVGIYTSAFGSGANMAPKIKPWFDSGIYPTLYGHTEVEAVTFADFGLPCTSGPRANLRDYAFSAPPDKNADSHAPLHTKLVELVNVEEDSVALMVDPNPEWINQADCIDMDCDGYIYVNTYLNMCV